MVLILPEHSQRPYRYGMTLLCVGAMFNWLGLADNNAEPVRYIGVTLIAAGALLICLAMCFWMKATHDPQVAMVQAEGDNMHHIVTIHHSDSILEKPPDYESVTCCTPPSYEDAIKLNPIHLLVGESGQLGVCKPEVASEQQELPSSSPCQVHRAAEDTDSKPDDADKSTVAPSVGAAATTSTNETASQPDNFGSKVLRLSRKFLGRAKSVPVEEADRQAEPTANDQSDTPVR